jgi:hypothetical protein
MCRKNAAIVENHRNTYHRTPVAGVRYTACSIKFYFIRSLFNAVGGHVLSSDTTIGCLLFAASNADFAGLKTRVDGLKTRVANLKTRVCKWKVRIAGLKNRFSNYA